LILTLFNVSIGTYYLNNGDRYEGEWKEGYINGKGRKFDSQSNFIEEGILPEGVLN